VFTEDGETFADVRDVGVRAGLVRVAEHGGGLSGQGCGEDPVAEVGLCAAAGGRSSRRRGRSRPGRGRRGGPREDRVTSLPGVGPSWCGPPAWGLP
jgi:hypothetical protein